MLNAKEGQTYVCTMTDRPWWTKGKEYEVVLNNHEELCFVDDDGDARWTIGYLNNLTRCQFRLKDKQSKVTMEDLKAKSVEQKYTGFDVSKVIIRAHNMYDNDAQRLAFIKGYFAK